MVITPSVTTDSKIYGVKGISSGRAEGVREGVAQGWETEKRVSGLGY